eukprot:COSAG01_NODE_1015_length_12114_cov_214.545651_8_plen_261_part_00
MSEVLASYRSVLNTVLYGTVQTFLQMRIETSAHLTATGFAGWQSYAHTSDTSQILPRSCGLAVRELLLAARPKFTGIYVGNGLRFAEIRLSRLKKHTHTHTSDTHACTTAMPTSESGCGRPAPSISSAAAAAACNVCVRAAATRRGGARRGGPPTTVPVHGTVPRARARRGGGGRAPRYYYTLDRIAARRRTRRSAADDGASTQSIASVSYGSAALWRPPSCNGSVVHASAVGESVLRGGYLTSAANTEGRKRCVLRCLR